MPKRSAILFLVDILVSIDKIKRNTENVGFNEFITDENLFDATARSLEIIGEAANNLLKDKSFIEHIDVEWRKIVDFRNILVHEYFGIDLGIIFSAVKEEVPALEEEILNFIQKKENKTNFIQALLDTKQELEEINRKDSIAYLEKIRSLIEE